MNETLIILNEDIIPKVCRQNIFDDCRNYILSYSNSNKVEFCDLRKLYKIRLIIRFVLYVGAYSLMCNDSQMIVFRKYVSIMNELNLKIISDIKSKCLIEFNVG